MQLYPVVYPSTHPTDLMFDHLGITYIYLSGIFNGIYKPSRSLRGYVLNGVELMRVKVCTKQK